MPSVKRVRVEEVPEEGLGRGSFYFTDDYSVFDWGRMPDRIRGKGASLCATGAHTFERLEAEGIPTHYRGVLTADGDAVALDDIDHPPREMGIELGRAPELPYDEDADAYDYEAYHETAATFYLVPLEVVFRNTVPEGSSLRERTEPGDHGLDFEAWPDGAVDLDDPVVEFSTKFERSDRYLDRGEAADIAGVADLDAIEAVGREVNRVVTDVVGTFDENRFSFDGQQVSKEVVRRYYRREHPDWVEDVKAGKRAARKEGVVDWTAMCEHEPEPLPEDVLAAVSDLYRAGANAYTGRDLFDAPPIEAAVEAAREL
ncbi:MAG: phosphoribosylaminoimidazolesuccinocarboxamide synthase [Halobacteriaceae archaeon]